MSFKKKKGEVSWYVIALILAIVILVVSLFVVPKIREAQKSGGDTIKSACEIAGGNCMPQGETGACTTGFKIPGAPCPTENYICCKE